MDPEQTLQEARGRILACTDANALKDVERDYVGKKGVVAGMLAAIPTLAPEERKAHGQKANVLSLLLMRKLSKKLHELANNCVDKLFLLLLPVLEKY